MRSPTRRRTHRAALAAIAGAACGAGCAAPVRAPATLALPAPFAADSQTVRTVAPGVVHRTLYVGRGPWAVHVLDVAPGGCWTLAARKAGGAAVGRAGTLALARALDSAGRTVAGAVNADFFLFAPPGVTTGLHVERGAVVTGPAGKPSVAVDAAGTVRIATFAARGRLLAGGDTTPIVAWNRGAAAGAALFDARYGARTDSAARRTFVHLAPLADGRAVVTAIDSGASAAIAADERVLAVHRAPAARVGDTVAVSVALAPWAPRDAVSGRGVLVRGGAVAPDVDTEGQASFRARNPRTAVGIAPDGRALLVVVDGRQPGWSDGMTLRELAELFRAFGASEALNLDGGGSSTLVVRDTSGALRIANRTSDKEGERPVGNALAVVRACDAARGR